MTPLADVITLPFMPIPSAEAGSAVLWQLYEKYPSLAKSFAANHIQLLWTSDPYFIITSKKQVKTLEDIKGLKLRTIGGPPVDQLKALGAVPMMIPMPDCYLNLQKGVIDGMGAPWEAIEDNKLMEAVKYYTYVPLYVGYFSIAWNRDKWNSLPPDIQNAIMKNCGGLVGSKYGGYNMFDTAAKEGPALVKKEGLPIIEYTLPPDEVEKWRKIAGEPIWEAWTKKMESSGYTEAREILNTTLNLIKAYK
jgi:TRAP-type C4-dicarboxylate transport system substrate-binding protein